MAQDEKKLETMDVEENSANGGVKDKYPKIAFLIILNELCERFSFYGLRTVLYIFFTEFLELSPNTATSIYHAFAMVAYFTPVLGAIVADGFLGLYRTILYVSCLYCCGDIVLMLFTMKPLGAPSIIGPAVGLVIIALGTGGIKPCVGAFGGNQFNQKTQKKQVDSFFSWFYLSINIGSTIGTILTPIFRKEKCFGADCYPLAFGVPAAFMFISIVLFFIGTPYYKREGPKQGPNVVITTVKCIGHAIGNRVSHGKTIGKKAHWLDYADDTYEPDMIEKVKTLVRIALLFVPLCIFWTLYDQQGSRWTAQAQQLNGRIGSITIQPDQFQVINPVLIVLLVPVFDMAIYPLFEKLGLLKKQLPRITIGLLFAVASFLIAALLEHLMQKASADLNPEHQLRVLNLLPCNLEFKLADGSVTNTVAQAAGARYETLMLDGKFAEQFKEDNNYAATFKMSCEGRFVDKDITVQRNATLLTSVLIVRADPADPAGFKMLQMPFSIKNQQIGTSEMKIYLYDYVNPNAAAQEPYKMSYYRSKIKYDKFDIEYLSDSVGAALMPAVKAGGGGGAKNPDERYLKLDYATYDIKLSTEDAAENEVILLQAKDILLETCGRYSTILFPSVDDPTKFSFAVVREITPCGMSIFWQLIQIFVMSVGEIMFSISGVTFAYSQAHASMKSVMQAVWFLTVAFGNLIVIIIAEARITTNQVVEYIFFAGLLFAATVIFTILAWFYKYVDPNEAAQAETTGAAVEDDQEKKRRDDGHERPSSRPYSGGNRVAPAAEPEFEKRAVSPYAARNAADDDLDAESIADDQRF